MKPSNEQSLVDPLINNHSKSWFSPWWVFGSAKVQDGVDEEQQEIRKKQSHHEETNHDDGTMKESAIHKYGVPTSNDLIGMEFEDEETARWMDTSGSTSGCTLMDGHGNEEDDTLTTNVALMHIHGSQKNETSSFLDARASSSGYPTICDCTEGTIQNFFAGAVVLILIGMSLEWTIGILLAVIRDY